MMLKLGPWLTLIALMSNGLTASPADESQWDRETADCTECHEQIVKQFRATGHGKAMEFGMGGQVLTCGTCHPGDLAEHVETADPQFVRSPERPEAVAESCLGCHINKKGMMFWHGSQHEVAGVSCLSCHSEHKPSEGGRHFVKKTEAETCFTCHSSVRKAMLQRSTHLFRDERGAYRLLCSTCHNPHGSQAEMLISANSINDKCYSCHQEKRGPFLWEHPPVRENCMNCHTPHGSNNEQLLTLRRPQLCQSCHLQQRHQTVAGRPSAMFNINRSCQNCHAAVHGSNHPSGVTLIW